MTLGTPITLVRESIQTSSQDQQWSAPSWHPGQLCAPW